MKQLILAIVTLFALISCSSNEHIDVAIAYTENLTKGNINEARKYATEQVIYQLNLLEENHSIKTDRNYKCEVVWDSLSENNSWVKYLNQEKKFETIKLVKINDTWKVTNEGQTVIGDWRYSAGDNSNSFRNCHYTFKLSSRKEIKVFLETEKNSLIHIIDSLGFNVMETTDKLFTKELPKGKYRVVVGTEYEGGTGSFKLTVDGASDLQKIESNYYQIVDSWTSSGGKDRFSFRNNHYELNITKDTYIDALISSEIDYYIYLIDSLGFTTETNQIIGTRLISKPIKAGKYELVAATEYPDKPENGQNGAYKLHLFGQFDQPVKIKSVELMTQGTWINSGGRDRKSVRNPKFTFQVTEEDYVDILLSQPSSESVYSRLYLVQQDGTVFESRNLISNKLTPGTYTIVAATEYPNEKGNFLIKIFGKSIKSLQSK